MCVGTGYANIRDRLHARTHAGKQAHAHVPARARLHEHEGMRAHTPPHNHPYTYTTNQVNFCEFQVLFLLMGVRVQLALVQSAVYTLLLGVGLYLAGVNLFSTAAASLAFMMIWGICIALVLDMQVVHSAYDMLRSLYIYNS
jgi:hypothetical protein